MKFCEVCNNMYYNQLDANDPNKLTHYCRYCGHVDESLSIEGVCVLNTQFKKGNESKSLELMVNRFTKLDPTLPRTTSMKCPNAECLTNTTENDKKPTEIIYMRYDDDNMKYLYICVKCNHKWVNS